MANADARNAQPFFFEGGSHACLLIHGFTGSPSHMRPLGERLHEAGYTVRGIRLPGHGTTLEDMRDSSWRDWLAAARLAYSELREKYERVTVMGLSMGGVLSLILAEEYPVDGVVTLSAPILLQNRASVFSPLIAAFAPILRWENVPHGGDWLEEYDCGYDGLPSGRVYDLRKLISIAYRNLYAVTAPALILQSVHDENVRPKSAELIRSGIRSERKKLLYLENSTHVCTLGPDRERVTQEILDFLAANA